VKTRFLAALASILLATATVRAEETFDEAMKRATADYGERLQKAAEELSVTRKRIADEKAPLLK
jgi:F0F1-type ATP synthase membrane subunit b/b'